MDFEDLTDAQSDVVEALPEPPVEGQPGKDCAESRKVSLRESSQDVVDSTELGQDLDLVSTGRSRGSTSDTASEDNVGASRRVSLYDEIQNIVKTAAVDQDSGPSRLTRSQKGHSRTPSKVTTESPARSQLDQQLPEHSRTTSSEKIPLYDEFRSIMESAAVDQSSEQARATRSRRRFAQ